LCGSETLVHFADGDAVSITAEKEPVRFLLVSGKPIGEPVAWYGPIVMNYRRGDPDRIRRVPERDLHQAMTHKRADEERRESAEV